MAQQIINTGTAPTDGTGDPARTAFTKCNDNFTELYAASAGTATPPQGRLTLVTVTPVMGTTQTAKTMIFYTPYVGNQVPIYDGTNMVMTAFSELSNVTTASSVGNAGPAVVAASSLYDLFIWSNAGTVTLTRGPAWTSATARSAGTALTLVNGIWLNNAAITNGPAASRGTYVGTVRSNASSQIDWHLGGTATGGTAGFLGVYNAYNRMRVLARSFEQSAGWTHAGTSFGSMNSSTGNRVSWVDGLGETSVMANCGCVATNDSAQSALLAIGLDSTSAPMTNSAIGFCDAFGVLTQLRANAWVPPQLGFHFVQALDACALVTVTAYYYGIVGGIRGTSPNSAQLLAFTSAELDI